MGGNRGAGYIYDPATASFLTDLNFEYSKVRPADHGNYLKHYRHPAHPQSYKNVLTLKTILSRHQHYLNMLVKLQRRDSFVFALQRTDNVASKACGYFCVNLPYSSFRTVSFRQPDFTAVSSCDNVTVISN